MFKITYVKISGVELTLDKQWCGFFKSNNKVGTFSQLREICEFYF